MAKQLTEEERKAKEVVDTIATEIAKLSRQVSALLSGRLNRKAIITLLVSSTKLPQKTVDNVLTAIEQLEPTYLKKEKN